MWEMHHVLKMDWKKQALFAKPTENQGSQIKSQTPKTIWHITIKPLPMLSLVTWRKIVPTPTNFSRGDSLISWVRLYVVFCRRWYYSRPQGEKKLFRWRHLVSLKTTVLTNGLKKHRSIGVQGCVWVDFTSLSCLMSPYCGAKTRFRNRVPECISALGWVE